MKGFIYYIAKRSGVELNKSDINNLSTEQLAEKLFDDPLVQIYFKDGKEIDYNSLISNEEIEFIQDVPIKDEISFDIGIDKEKHLIDKFIGNKLDPELVEDAKMQMMYIAKRTGVVFNEGGHHGLFGKVGDNEFCNIRSLTNTMNYVGEKVRKEKMITYSCVISFSPEDALEQGFTNQEKFKILLQENIFKIAEKVGVPPSRLEYVGAVHLKKENPHMHFMFWDKAQQVKQAFVHENISKGIHDDLVNIVYKNELSQFYETKNNARDKLTLEFGKQYNEVANYYISLPEQKYLEARKNANKLINIQFDNKLKPDFIKRFGKEFLIIAARLPKTGSLKFEYLDPVLKERITTTVKKLVEQNEDYKNEYNRFINTAVNIAKMYSNNSDNLEQARKNAEEDITKRMSNQLINAIKEIKKYDRTLSKSENNESTADIVLSVFRTLAQSSHELSNRHSYEKGELSKQARIELGKKMEFASDLDWSEER